MAMASPQFVINRNPGPPNPNQFGIAPGPAPGPNMLWNGTTWIQLPDPSTARTPEQALAGPPPGAQPGDPVYQNWQTSMDQMRQIWASYRPPDWNAISKLPPMEVQPLAAAGATPVAPPAPTWGAAPAAPTWGAAPAAPTWGAAPAAPTLGTAPTAAAFGAAPTLGVSSMAAPAAPALAPRAANPLTAAIQQRAAPRPSFMAPSLQAGATSEDTTRSRRLGGSFGYGR